MGSDFRPIFRLVFKYEVETVPLFTAAERTSFRPREDLRRATEKFGGSLALVTRAFLIPTRPLAVIWPDSRFSKPHIYFAAGEET